MRVEGITHAKAYLIGAQLGCHGEEMKFCPGQKKRVIGRVSIAYLTTSMTTWDHQKHHPGPIEYIRNLQSRPP